ncbi:unnamed protein product [Bursaphelenchus okinawaensis]|uniref:AB hydrolase-1 domain-containing protein n=1 Tax=Bursaphelenchus okinawaensis TaxID=465554 RepID=A0A811KRX0_9BILA|nr:unnamed protein product [Bursaphelenchus okinawaensis]CAG9109641.1 unnamed protein product [Bursaphelenchus okinawaensis]
MFQQRDSNTIPQEDLEKVIVDINNEIDHLKTETNYINIGEHRIFYSFNRSGSKHLPLVVLVHDQINSSSIWMENETVKNLVINDYNYISLDLPTHGQSLGPNLEQQDKYVFFTAFLQQICALFRQDNVVLCGASMAGQYIIPTLNHGIRGVNIKGLVAIALSDTEVLNTSRSLPKTLLVRGEWDTSIGPNAAAVFGKFENCNEFVIANGRHFCHLGSTADEFNRLLLGFLKDL